MNFFTKENRLYLISIFENQLTSNSDVLFNCYYSETDFRANEAFSCSKKF